MHCPLMQSTAPVARCSTCCAQPGARRRQRRSWAGRAGCAWRWALPLGCSHCTGKLGRHGGAPGLVGVLPRGGAPMSCSAKQHAHCGLPCRPCCSFEPPVVHRDFKSPNLLLTASWWVRAMSAHHAVRAAGALSLGAGRWVGPGQRPARLVQRFLRFLPVCDQRVYHRSWKEDPPQLS